MIKKLKREFNKNCRVDGSFKVKACIGSIQRLDDKKIWSWIEKNFTPKV